MPKVPFAKPVETSTQLLNRLVGRGLCVADKAVVYAALGRIGYYRLSGYMIPFQTGHQPDPHTFKRGATIEAVLALYELDRALRQLVLEAVEGVEVALRSSICNHLAKSHGAHWHADQRVFHAAVWPDLHARISAAMDFDPATNQRASKAKTGKHLFLDHYYATYDPPPMPPAWMFMEVASFGTIARLFQAVAATSDRKAIAGDFQFANRRPIDEAVLANWLHGLSVLRNRCAHHSRIVYRTHPFAPVATTNASVAHHFKGGSRLREFLVTTALLSSMAAPKSGWARRLYFLLDSMSNVDISMALGFAADWRADSLWELF